MQLRRVTVDAEQRPGAMQDRSSTIQADWPMR